ncbi:hypothetical protein, partial [Actinotignum sp. GS-2025a]|uniref:hypothetical protein n=1 Tax=Actinotignum sp. GS-2025a TaxID=3427274 RepID=UPI003F48AB18
CPWPTLTGLISIYKQCSHTNNLTHSGPDIMKAATALNVSARAIFGRALLGNEFVRADRPGEDTAAMGKMYTAALDYFAAMRLVSPR